MPSTVTELLVAKFHLNNGFTVGLLVDFFQYKFTFYEVAESPLLFT
jgi:hypothetical protein